MNKKEFISALRRHLKSLPKREREERLSFYGEAIDDRVEEGFSEEDAVADIGAVDEIAALILNARSENNDREQAAGRERRSLKWWELVLIIVGFPLWGSLLISVISMIFFLYISVWTVLIALWAVFGALCAYALGALAGGTVLAVTGTFYTGIALVGVGLICGGLAIFMFFGSNAATNGVILLTKKAIKGIKKLFVGGGKKK